MKNHFKVVCDDCKEVITTKDYLCIIDNQTKIVKYNSHIEMEDCPKFKKKQEEVLWKQKMNLGD